MYQPQNQNAARMAAPTSSQSVTKTVNGSHKFVIRGYSLAKGMGVGKHIASDTFSVGGYQWAIYFYPDGKNPEDNSAYVSVFIALASEGTDVRALFELTLLDQSGNSRHKVHSHFDRSLESGPYTLKYRGSMWGYKRFFRRVMLETSDFLKDDCLKINCTVGVVVSEVDCPAVQPLKVPEPDMGSEFAMFLDSEEGADVTFDVSGEKFRAHKIILAARSPILQAAFSDVMDKDEHEVFITDMEPNVFKALLHYIYKDDLDEEAEEPSKLDPCEQPVITEKKETKLLAAADRYGLPRLRVICESRLCKDITVDNVATILALAERHHAVQLKAVCLEFAAENLIAVMHTDGFQCLKENFPRVQSELLKAVAGFEAQFIGGGQHRGMWAKLSDREETHAGVARQLTLENIEASTHTENLWIGVSNSRRDSAGNPPPEQ